MSASLFHCPTLGFADALPKIETPLGTLTLDAEVDGVLIADLKPSAAYHLEHDRPLLRWVLDGIMAKLLLCRPHDAIPDSMAVDDCWAGMWRVHVSVPAETLEFSCLWEPGYLWTEVCPNSGEGLDAQTWEQTDQEKAIKRVTVGTVDAGGLAGHAQRGLLPHQWADLLGDSYGGAAPDPRTGKINPVVYSPNGFRIVLPALTAGEHCQVQFVVARSLAMNTEEAENDIPTWLAVDCRPESILAGVGCH